METLHPGLKDILEKTGLSVQAQDHYPIRTVLEQRGEKTINKRYQAFSTNSSSVFK